MQGVGLAELALQQASDWARSRIQGRPAGGDGKAAVTIGHHPDVRRMLLTMKANVEAMRALALYAALQLDRARAEPDEARRAAALTRGELLIPIVKGWCTDQASELASLAVQVHGGMGFIEETGVAQTLRDVRITSIYEGTTGIQANDLVGRKLGRDRGAAMTALLSDTMRELNDLKGSDATIRSARNATIEALTMLRDATEVLRAQVTETPARAYAVAVPYLHLCGRVLGGAMMARSAAIAAARLAGGGGGSEVLSRQAADRALLCRASAAAVPEPAAHHQVRRRQRGRGRSGADLASAGGRLAPKHRHHVGEQEFDKLPYRRRTGALGGIHGLQLQRRGHRPLRQHALEFAHRQPLAAQEFRQHANP